MEPNVCPDQVAQGWGVGVKGGGEGYGKGLWWGSPDVGVVVEVMVGVVIRVMVRAMVRAMAVRVHSMAALSAHSTMRCEPEIK